MPNRRSHLRVAYGMTEEHYRWLLERQNGGCAICGGPPTANRWRDKFFVDHDHATGRVRGLLCHHCNAAIGYLKDDPALLRKAAMYVETDGVADAFEAAALTPAAADPRHYASAPYAKLLDWEKVAAIRRRLADGETATAVAKDFDVSQEMVSRIKRGKAWVNAEEAARGTDDADAAADCR